MAVAAVKKAITTMPVSYKTPPGSITTPGGAIALSKAGKPVATVNLATPGERVSMPIPSSNGRSFEENRRATGSSHPAAASAVTAAATTSASVNATGISLPVLIIGGIAIWYVFIRRS
ncbi:MAG TPA: hypothetical protein VGG48_19095 [Rhizomicrobium sp.]|jgi:hypothetical protein